MDVTVTATGSRTANWNITYDTSNLPDDWTVEPQAGSTLLNVELTPAVPIVIPFVAALPSDALGDEDGFIEVEQLLLPIPA